MLIVLGSVTRADPGLDTAEDCQWSYSCEWILFYFKPKLYLQAFYLIMIKHDFWNCW